MPGRYHTLLHLLACSISMCVLSACATRSHGPAQPWQALPSHNCHVAFSASLAPLPSPWNRWSASRVTGQRYVHVLGYQDNTVWLASSHLNTQESASVRMDSALTFELATWRAGRWAPLTPAHTLKRSSTVSLSPHAALQTSPLIDARLEAQRDSLTEEAQQACALSLIRPA